MDLAWELSPLEQALPTVLAAAAIADEIGLVFRRAPCSCRWTMKNGQLVSFIDCARHGAQAGQAEDLTVGLYDLFLEA